MTDAVIFDLDGVILDSEQIWDRARREITQSTGGRWTEGATQAMMGMSSTEWSEYLHDQLGVPLDPHETSDKVAAEVLDLYRRELPILPGAVDAVKRMASRWPLGLASSSNRPVIDAALVLAGIDQLFEVTVSSEEVPRGKPAPDVYLEAARRLGVAAPTCAVVEDSANGIRSAVGAGMKVVAIPNAHFPPPPECLDMAAYVLRAISQLMPDVLD